MISVIICSRVGKLKSNFKANITNTVGCLHELIVIDNSKNKYSIYEAYNIGISKSRFEIMCFLHEDIFIHTAGWGFLLLDMFQKNPKYGLIGIAGSRIKTKIPSGWWDCESEDKIINIIQHFPSGKVEKQTEGFVSTSLEKVVVVDGVFLGLRNINNINFNESLKGFHGYDLNISLEVIKKGYQVAVTNLILIEHYSLGKLNLEWLTQLIKVHKIYYNDLPLSLHQKERKEFEVLNCVKLIQISRKLKATNYFLRYWLKLIWMDPSNKLHFDLLNRIFLKLVK